jgi:hypothetical protein
MRTYIVSRGSGGQVGCVVKMDRCREGRDAYILKRCVYHSPSGFETGYGGSGPADLALSILADYFGVTPEEVHAIKEKTWAYDNSVNLKPLKLQQPFKFKFIAPRQLEPGQSYEILGAEIASWLGDLEHKSPVTSHESRNL